MKLTLVFSLAAVLAAAFRDCRIVDQGVAVVRSCPSLSCSDMGNLGTGDSATFNCWYNNGERVGGESGWVWSHQLDGYVRKGRLDDYCCRSCLPQCNTCWDGDTCGCSGNGCNDNGCGSSCVEGSC
ncbi:hypothetical protein B0J14DRAFT_591972 [Halenospora varia]|nr:hypothetical protein B0J14DRAFT_591972 [Halenospora varia]